MRLLSASILMSIIFLPGSIPGHSQAANGPVQWTFEPNATNQTRRGSTTTLRIDAHIKEGWHVYGSAQLEGGPTPLKVSLEENPIAQVAGKIASSEATKDHDASFNLETSVYTKDFFVKIPVKVKSDAALGTSAIPVSVRYQSCSDRTCMPPKTLHIQVPVSVVAVR